MTCTEYEVQPHMPAGPGILACVRVSAIGGVTSLSTLVRAPRRKKEEER